MKNTLLYTFIIVTLIDCESKKNEERISQNAYLNKSDNSISSNDFYRKFNNNRVVFDENYEEKQVQIIGVIENIKESWNCYYIELKVEGEGLPLFAVISCSNCGAATSEKLKQAWKQQIAAFSKGNTVSIRGKYSKNLSSNEKLSLYECSIIE